MADATNLPQPIEDAEIKSTQVRNRVQKLILEDLSIVMLYQRLKILIIDETYEFHHRIRDGYSFFYVHIQQVVLVYYITMTRTTFIPDMCLTSDMLFLISAFH